MWPVFKTFIPSLSCRILFHPGAKEHPELVKSEPSMMNCGKSGIVGSPTELQHSVVAVCFSDAVKIHAVLHAFINGTLAISIDWRTSFIRFNLMELGSGKRCQGYRSSRIVLFWCLFWWMDSKIVIPILGSFIKFIRESGRYTPGIVVYAAAFALEFNHYDYFLLMSTLGTNMVNINFFPVIWQYVYQMQTRV